MLSRRGFLAAGAAVATGWTPARAVSPAPLAMPQMVDATQTGRIEVQARHGLTRFFPGGGLTHTAGFNGGYLGPTLRIRRGVLDARVGNALTEPVSSHWHGLLIRGEHDGGPHSAIAPGQVWHAEMDIAQSPATLWYHSHIHGRTAPHVYWGLAGMLQITDGRDDQRGLPSAYGVDDLAVIIQDRRFDDAGRMVYEPTMTDILNGFQAERVLINGQANAVAVVPQSMVRLRLLNGSNARIYMLAFADRRPMHLVATDSGFVEKPAALTFLRLAPGERAEVLVDFSDGRDVLLQSTRGLPLPVLRFATDPNLPRRIDRLPDALDEDADDLGPPVRKRGFSLNVGGGSGGLAGGHDHQHSGMAGSGVSDFGINGAPMNMNRIDQEVKLGTVERWTIGGGGAIEHPFHVHGVRFRVLGEAGGTAPSAQNRGWKDVVLVAGTTDILMRFDHTAPRDFPYMFHCHILEHEDAGMMGQFTVT